MAENSGHEDFFKEAKALDAMAADVEKLAAAEAQRQGVVAKGAEVDLSSARATRTRVGAKKEAIEVTRREAEVAKQAATATRAETALIEANTEARQRANRVQSMRQKAIPGAQSPQYAAAYQMYQESGTIPSQYRMRKELQGVGQRRAAAMQQAMEAGLVPSAGGVDVNRPISRVVAAHEAVAASEYKLAQANEDYTRIKKKGTEAEALAAYNAREAAKSGRQSAVSELAAAQKSEAEALTRNQQAIHREIESRGRVLAQMGRDERLLAAAHQAEERRIGALDQRTRDERILSRIEQAERSRVEQVRPGQLALPAAGQTAQGMQVYPAQTRIRVGGYPDDGSNIPAPRQAPGPNWTPVDPAAVAKQAEATGNLAKAEALYTNELNNPKRAAALRLIQETAAWQDKAAESTRRTAAAFQQSAAGMYPLDQQMHRHGALTSEFIAAAARGEVTLRELGNQAVITAGKFGGWTIAAAGVYGVVGALQQVGKGAMDASSGADQAFRVITQNKDRGAIQGSFADLSKTFNVPIETAADAVYRMGQVFHDQDQAVKAATASLLSYKTGEVSVEDSTKNLIAIQRAYGLSSEDLVGIFDQINQAQNVFGVSIGNVESGLARAGGTWKNAGGDLSYLLAIMVAVQKATGESGTTIGTAMSRLYYVQHPENAEKLRQQGVDVDVLNAQTTFESLLKTAREPGADIQALASGFFGNQYARLFTSMLADQKTFNDALRDTSATASKGAGMNELAKVLSQVDEQIAALGNGLQRIGEELARSGAFTLFAVMLKMLNGTLTVTEKLLDVFNMLPTPLRQTLVIVGEIALVMAALRKFGATERLVNSPLGSLANPEGRLKTHTVVGLRQGVKEAANRAERYGQRDVDAAHDLSMRQAVARELKDEADSLSHLDAENKERIDAMQRSQRASQEVILSEKRLAASNRELQSARQIAAAREEALTLAQNTPVRNFRNVAMREQWVKVNELDQPNMQGTTLITGGRRAPVPPIPRAPVPVGGAAGAAAAVGEATRRQAVVTALSMRAAEARAAASAAPSQMSAILARTGVSGALLARGATRGTAAATKAATGMRGAMGALRGLGPALGGLAAAFGPLDILLLGILGIGLFKDQVNKIEKRADDARKALAAPARTQAEVKKQQDEAWKVLRSNQQVTPTTSPASGGFLAGAKDAWASTKTLWNDWTGVTDAANAAIEGEERRQAMIFKQSQAGKPRPQMLYEDLSKEVEDDAKLRQAGLISQREFDRRMGQHAIEAQVMYNANAKQVQAMKEKMAKAKVDVGGQSYAAGLRASSNDVFGGEMAGTGAAVELYGLTPHNIEYLKAQYQEAEQRWRNSKDPEALQKLNQARQAYFSAVIGEVQKELQLDLLQADTEQERRNAYAKASDSYNKMRITFKEQNTRMRENQKKERQELKKQQDSEDRGGSRHQRGLGDEQANDPQAGTFDPSDAEVKKREDRQRRERIKLTKEQREKLDKELARQNRELTLAQLQLKQQAYEDRQQGREILVNLQVSGTRDTGEQTRIRVEMAKKQVDDARREWGTKSRQYRQALTDLNNARFAQADAILAGVQADNAILLAQAGGDPVREARAQVDATQRELDAMKKNGADPNDIKQKQADLINQRRAAGDAADQQAEDMARLQGELASARAGDDPVLSAQAAITAAKLARQAADTPLEKLQALVDLVRANNQLRAAIAEREAARFDLLRSLTDDPVEQARLDMEQAKGALAGAKGLDKTKKQADYNNARRAWQQAKIDSAADDINFQLQMDQITNEEAAKQLEALANIKGISKAKKRELLLQAKALRDEASGDYELDVGSVRMPTLYEVKRFVTGGTSGPVDAQQGAVTDNRTFTVYLQTAEAVNAFAQQLELTNGTSAKSTARSMIMR